MKTYNGNRKKLTIPLSTAIGVLIALIITVVGGILGASMIHNGSMNENAYGTATFVTWMVASFAGAFVSGINYKDKFIVVSFISVVVYLFLMLSVAILFFDGNLQRIGQGIIAILIGFIPTILLNGMKAGRKNPKIRYRRR